MALGSLVDKPLMQNPLAGGGAPQIIDPSVITPRGSITDTRDKTLQDPYEIGGGGALGLASAIDGSGGGALFLPDENRPRSEEDIRNRYEQAKAQAAESRRNGFLGQVVLPGEMKYEDFKNMQNSFFLKRNPNIPESAYSNFDLTNVGGFDTPKAADPNNLLTGATPPTGGTFNDMPLFPETNIDDASMKGLPETNEPPMVATPMNPFIERGDSMIPIIMLFNWTGTTRSCFSSYSYYSRFSYITLSRTIYRFGNKLTGFGDQLTGFNDQLTGLGDQFSGLDKQFTTINTRLDNVDEGIASLSEQLQPQKKFYNSPYSNFNFRTNSYSNPSPFGLGSLFMRRY
jgi:hypothetical protein